MFKSPVGIAVHPVTGRVYVADTGNHRIHENLNFIGILAKEELVTISSSDHMTYPLLMMTIMLLEIFLSPSPNNSNMECKILSRKSRWHSRPQQQS